MLGELTTVSKPSGGVVSDQADGVSTISMARCWKQNRAPSLSVAAE